VALQDKDLAAAKLLLQDSGDQRPTTHNAATEALCPEPSCCLQDRQTRAGPAAAAGPVAQDRLGVGGAILLPIAGWLARHFRRCRGRLGDTRHRDELLWRLRRRRCCWQAGPRSAADKSRCFERLWQKGKPLVHLFRSEMCPSRRITWKESRQLEKNRARRYGYTVVTARIAG